MAKTLHAQIYPHSPTVIVERRMIDLAADIPAGPQQAYKQSLWRPVVNVGDDVFNSLTHKKTGPVTTIEPTQVVDTYSVVALTAQEISDARDAEIIQRINGSDRKALLKILLAIANDNRAIKRKINAIITATAIATPAFPAAQATSPANDWADADLKDYIKGLML
jgi:hypothetical protein